MRGGNSRGEYFLSDDERDESLKPKSMSFLDLSPSQGEFSGSKSRSLKKSTSFGPVHGDKKERQRPVRRKTSKTSKATPEPIPDSQEEFRQQRRPRRSTSGRRSKSSRSSPEPLPDSQNEAQPRRSRRSTSRRRSKSSRQSPTSLGSRDSKKKREGRKGERQKRSASMESKSTRASPEPIIRNIEGVPREQRQPKRSASTNGSSVPLVSHDGEHSDRLRRSKSMMEYSKAYLESTGQKRSLTPEQLRPRRSGSRAFQKSPTPLEWHQQLHQKEDQALERSGSRRSLVKKSKSFRKSPTTRESRKHLQQDDLESERPKSRKSLGNKSTSFRKSSTSLDPNQPSPWEWHQQLLQSEERLSERPRSRRSLGHKSESFRKSSTPLESRKHREHEDDQEEHSERRRRSMSGKGSKSSRKSPTPLESRQSRRREEEEDDEEDHSERRRRSMSGKGSKSSRKSPTPLESRQSRRREEEEDDEEERPSSRRSLGRKSSLNRRKSPTSLESRPSQRREGESDDEEERPNSRRSLGRKSSSFRRKSPTPLESRHHQLHGEEEDEHSERRRRSLGKKSKSFRRKSPTPLDSSLYPPQGEEEEEHSERRRRSLGRRSISFRRKSPTPLESRQHLEYQDQGEEKHLERPTRSLGRKSMSFRKKSPEARRSLTPDKLRPRRSMGRKLSLRNIFGKKNQQQREMEVDWKGFGLKECSYYQIDNNNSSGSLKKKASGSLTRLSSLTKLSRNSLSQNAIKRERMEEEENWQNATWDHRDDGKGSQELSKTPGPLKNWSAFRRVPNTGKTKHEEEDCSNYDRGYEDISLQAEEEEEAKPQSTRRWSFEKKHKDAHLLTSPRLEQVLLKRNERRERRSSLKKKLLGNVFSGQYRDVSDKNYSESKFQDNTERDSTVEAVSSQSHRPDDDDEDELGISITSSIAPSHNLKDEEVMLLLFRELQSI